MGVEEEVKPKITIDGLRDLLSFGWNLAELNTIKNINELFPIKEDYIKYRKGIVGEIAGLIAKDFDLPKADIEIVKRAIETKFYKEAQSLLLESLKKKVVG